MEVHVIIFITSGKESFSGLFALLSPLLLQGSPPRTPASPPTPPTSPNLEQGLFILYLVLLYLLLKLISLHLEVLSLVRRLPVLLPYRLEILLLRSCLLHQRNELLLQGLVLFQRNTIGTKTLRLGVVPAEGNVGVRIRIGFIIYLPLLSRWTVNGQRRTVQRIGRSCLAHYFPSGV